MDKLTNNPEILNQIIANRRSVYPQTYTDEIISNEVVNTILENASWAPSHKHTRPWHFVVFEGNGRKKLADFQSKLYKTLVPTDKFEDKKFNMLATKPLQCSHVIAICMKRSNDPDVPEIEEIEAVACAVQNMHLTASSYGVGAYWGSGGITYKEQAKDFFGLGTDDKLLGFFFMGYPNKENSRGAKRDWKNHVTWVK